MRRSDLKLYLSFIAAFLAMHYTGTALMKMPYILNAVIVCAVVFFVILFFNKVLNSKSVKTTIYETGLRKTNLPALAPGIFVSVALLITYPLLGYLLKTSIMLAENWHWNLAGLVFTAGVAEEMLFRGYLFGSLRRKMSFRKATLLSAICFTLAHLFMFTYMDWPVALLSTILAIATSLPLAFLFEKGNHSIWSPAIVHVAIRTVGMVVTNDEKHFQQFSLLWISACMIIPYIVLLFYKEFRAIFQKKV